MPNSSLHDLSNLAANGLEDLTTGAPVTGTQFEVETDLPVLHSDQPAYPHCQHARAFAVTEALRGLAEARDPGKPKRQRRAPPNNPRPATVTRTTRSSTATTRKRYKSAASIRSAKRAKTGFAKGTGYAGRTGTEWKGTSSKMLAEKARVDQLVSHWLERLRWYVLLSEDAPLASWPGYMRALLRERGLVAQVAAVLIEESIMDVQERIPVFLAALRVVHAICDAPCLRELVTLPSDEGKTIAELVDSMSRQAALLSGAGQTGMSENTAVLVKQIRRCIRLINRHELLSIAKERTNTSKRVVDLVDDDGDESAEKEGETCGEEYGAECAGASSAEKDEFADDKTAYLNMMKEHQFCTVPGLAQRSVFYQEAVSTYGMPSGKRQRRIAGEVASLLSSLPLSWSSTILLRVDEDRYDFLRAVIFGPEDTPYDSGAFVFDIYLPLDYPQVAPKFQLLTTGGGRVRFNPNLYNSGKVCLSLLGTWSGPSWTPASTILQVLVSIQSLILVCNPYFNEPGYERQMGTLVGDQQSSRYNERVRRDCALFAMQYNLRHPFPDVEVGLRTHFILKRRYIRHTFRQWFPVAMKQVEENGGDDVGDVKGVTADPTHAGAGSAGSGASGVAGSLMGTWVWKTIVGANSSLPPKATTTPTTMTAHAGAMGAGPASGAGAFTGPNVLAGASALAAGSAGASSNAASGAGGNLALTSLEKLVSDAKAAAAAKTTPGAMSALPASLSAFGMPSKSQMYEIFSMSEPLSKFRDNTMQASSLRSVLGDLDKLN